MLKEGLREAAVPKARAHQSGWTGSLVQAVVGAQGGLAGGSSPQGPGTPVLGGRGVLFRRWSVLKEGLREAAVPKARAHQFGGTGSPVQAVLGAQGGPTGASSRQGPGNISPWGRGVLSRRWSVLKEGLREAAAPKARAHQSGGTESLVEAVVGARGGLAGGSSPQGPRTPVWGDGESCTGGGRCSRRACGGQQSQGPGTPA